VVGDGRRRSGGGWAREGTGEGVVSGDKQRCRVREQCGRRWWAKERGWLGEGGVTGCAQ
jgi:hypothetical protein